MSKSIRFNADFSNSTSSKPVKRSIFRKQVALQGLDPFSAKSYYESRWLRRKASR